MEGTAPSVLAPVDRRAVIDWFIRNRKRSTLLFDLLAPEAYYSRPISLRHPIVFYEGHLAAFAVNTILGKALGRPGIDRDLDTLFARGIDPDGDAEAAARTITQWPARETVRQYVDKADRAILDVLRNEDLDAAPDPDFPRSEAIYAVLEHELLHQETLLYIWHRLPFDQKHAPAGLEPVRGGAAPAVAQVYVPAGVATLGADRHRIRFGWDNEFPAHHVDVPGFAIDVHNVTNEQFMQFVEARGYSREELWTPAAWRWLREERHQHPLFWERHGDGWMWRGMFELIPLPPAWPVYVSHAEAAAFARWRGLRLPTEAEFDRAAYGAPSLHERAHPWGDEPPDSTRGNFAFERCDPVPVGHHPRGRSAWGIEDLVGNGWEWTSTIFNGFPGFRPMQSYPEYSADFFDGQHYVMKGASPATGRELLRRSMRNWFRPTYPYVYATFRCVKGE